MNRTGPDGASISTASRMPRITIITPCLNGEAYLVEAIESVLQQNYPACEHIIVDGGSTDGTASLLRRYPHLTIVRDRDEGSHDAMNVGIAKATGDLIGFLNVDDIYPPETLNRVATAFAASPDADVVVGDSLVFEEAKSGHRVVRFVFPHRRGIWLPECLFGNPAINGCFFRSGTFEKIGTFDAQYDFTADRNFFIRLALASLKATTLDEVAICYRAHERSRTMNRGRANIIPIAEELFCMAQAFRHADTPQLDPVTARSWSALECARLIFAQLRYGHLAGALRLLFQYGILLPYAAHGLLLRRTARRQYRGAWNADLRAVLDEYDGLGLKGPRPDAKPAPPTG
jgi:glycosyltransferase involved in cell wall biosynthesis